MREQRGSVTRRTKMSLVWPNNNNNRYLKHIQDTLRLDHINHSDASVHI